MSLLAEIGQHLEDQGHGTQGTDIFLGNMPTASTAIDNLIAVYEYISEEPVQAMGPNGTAPIMVRPRVQVQVRNTSYETCATNAKNVFDDLHWFNGTLSSVVYYNIAALQNPFSLGRDENNRTTFVCNYRVWKDPS